MKADIKDIVNPLYMIYGYLLPVPGDYYLAHKDYHQDNMQSLFIRVFAHESIIEVPLFARDYIQDKFIDSLQDFIMPLYLSDRGKLAASTKNYTALTLIKRLAHYVPSIVESYTSLYDTKGERYYGCNGVLFNESMQPLLISTLEGEIKDKIITYKKVKSYIHPSVLSSTGSVEKFIAKKLIPYILSNGVCIVSPESSNIKYDLKYVDDKNLYTVPEVILADAFDKFFVRTIPPSGDYNNTKINELLSRNIEDVFSAMNI